MEINAIGRVSFRLVFSWAVCSAVFAAAGPRDVGRTTTIANPASVYCEKKGGKLEIRPGTDGEQNGVCIFENGVECEEWAFFRGECKTSQPLSGPGGTQRTRFSDPFAYCAVVGTLDVPDDRYVGPKVPDVVIKALRKEMTIAEDAPEEWIGRGTFWRCMDNKVWACFTGANLPCMSRVDTSRTPSTAMQVYCKANPDHESIPASVTGRETAYAWRCSAADPQIVQEVIETDERGFPSDFWYEIERAPGSNP